MDSKNLNVGFRNSKHGIIAPTLEELKDISQQYHMNMSSEDLLDFASLIEGSLDSYRRVAQMPEPHPAVKYPRTPGYRPSADENPLNAWHRRCSIEGSKNGKLSGKKIALKDNICTAGIPMSNGSTVLDGFIPEIDATIVTRILDAGGEIIGKATCENFCLSGGSHTSATGPVFNPHKPTYSAGGSSSGCAALVVNGDCDMAIGGDQGGSIRIPSSLCGAYGLKPTYGLVPYTGILPLEYSLDHTGPICSKTEDLAILLEVIAGKDPLDPRQHDNINKVEHTKALNGNAKGLRIGVLREGFGWPGVEVGTDEIVREAAFSFEKAGAKIEEVSIPIHREGVHIWNCIAFDGIFQQLFRNNGLGMGWKGYQQTGASSFFYKSKKTLADNFSDPVKLLILLGHYMIEKNHGIFYAKAQNQVPLLCEAYDEALTHVDLLAMPTVAPHGKARKIIDYPTREEYFDAAFCYHFNTCPFNNTGHPAVTVPSGRSDGLPVGMMLVGRQFEDATVLRAAHAFQTLGIYK